MYENSFLSAVSLHFPWNTTPSYYSGRVQVTQNCIAVSDSIPSTATKTGRRHKSKALGIASSDVMTMRAISDSTAAPVDSYVVGGSCSLVQLVCSSGVGLVSDADYSS